MNELRQQRDFNDFFNFPFAIALKTMTFLPPATARRIGANYASQSSEVELPSLGNPCAMQELFPAANAQREKGIDIFALRRA